MLKKVLIIFGTRPEAIKMAPVCKAFLAEKKIFETKICVTGQHREMLDQVLDIFQIIPDIDLNLMKANQDLFDVTSLVLLGMKKTLSEYKPDLVLVHGDTSTSLAAAIACFYSGVTLGHVEAGLRTNNILSPFPEEFNRQVISKLSKWHFAPTELSKKNLISEKIANKNILVTGNTVIDALHWVLDRIEKDPKRKNKIVRSLNSLLPFDWKKNKFILITGHRRENFGEGFLEICKALKYLSERYEDLNFVYPVHLNPNVQKPVRDILSKQKNIHLIEPLEYEPFVLLLKLCYIVLTDSGGIQEEAPSLGKPVLVMRNLTERPEALEAGTVKLVGANKNQILSTFTELFNSPDKYIEMSRAHNPYGDGKASNKILSFLAEKYAN